MSTSGRAHVDDLPTASDVRWRVVEIDMDGLRARLAPYLAFDAMAATLDATFGIDGWGNRFIPFRDDAVGCELEAAGVVKSALARSPSQTVDATELAAAALTRTAVLHGVRLPFDVQAAAWVDWDPDRDAPLYWPDLEEAAPPSGAAPTRDAADGTPEAVPEAPAAPLGTQPDASEQVSIRSEGQQAIDKLVDRLREAGHGLEAARLVNAHQGYGTDPDAARELYARLRRLLLDGTRP